MRGCRGVEGHLDAAATGREATTRTLLKAVKEVSPDIEQNTGCVPHEGEHDRQDERISMGFVGSPLTQGKARVEVLSSGD